MCSCTVTRWIEDAPDGTETGEPTETAAPTETGDTQTGDSGGAPCPLPVPDHVTLESPVYGSNNVRFYVPHSGWALASLHASRQLAGLAREDIDLRLSPAWFFAVALETSFMGCSDQTPADPLDASNTYPRRTDSDLNGCLGLAEDLHLFDLCRLYPETLACTDDTHAQVISSDLQATTGRDNIEPGILATGFYALFSYAMLQWSSGAGLADPDAWLAAAADPYAVEKLMALAHRESAYSSLVRLSVQGCQDQAIEACWETRAPSRAALAQGVASHVAVLDAGVAAGSCYDRDLSAAEIEAYVAAIAPLFPDLDAAAAAAAGLAALETAVPGAEQVPFQQVADAVLDGIDTALPWTLRCPGSELTTAFGMGCPP